MKSLDALLFAFFVAPLSILFTFVFLFYCQ